MKTDFFHLIWDIRHSPWMVSDPETMAAVARRLLDRAPVEIGGEPVFPYMEETESDGDDAEADKHDLIAIVPLHGTMTKYDNCGAMGTKSLADYMTALAEDADVVGVVLDVDSGGGSVSAVPPLLEAISALRAAGKPVYAHCDMVGSAAYYVACACDAVYLDNYISSEAGSIGAFYVYVDDTAPNPQTGEKYITVYPPESSEKNFAYRQALEGDFGPAEKELSATVRQFQDFVRLHRPALKSDSEGVLTGRMFRADDAVRIGLADAVLTLRETIEAVAAATSV